MSSEGDEVRAGESYELKMTELQGKLRESKVTGSVAIAELTEGGFRVEAYDETGVRVLPRVWDTMHEADAFALGFLEGLDQGMINAINALVKLDILDPSRIQILPQNVTEGPDATDG